MGYKKVYLERLYNNLYSYSAISEIFGIISAEIDKLREEDRECFYDLGKLMNWEARSTNSGVWTYYEGFGSYDELVSKDFLKGDHEIISKYNSGLGKFTDEELMNKLDTWIVDNEEIIFRYFGDLLIGYKQWLIENIGA